MMETQIKPYGLYSFDGWANRFYFNANSAWENLYAGLCMDGDEVSPRGKKIRETTGCNIYISNPNDNLIYSDYRGLSPVYAAREYMWYKSGSRDPMLAPNSKFWQSIANEEDGLINSNYGAYIFVPESDGKSVWDKTVDILKNDPDSRQAIIQIPIMPSRGKKDTPCTSSIQFFIRNEKLFATVYMRSCDIVAGFPYDIFQFTMWQIEMASALGIGLGWIRFIAGSLHVYEEDWIQNREPFYTTDITSGWVASDKSSQEFRDDLARLAEDGKSAQVNDETLNYMLNHMKIWKRENW